VCKAIDYMIVDALVEANPVYHFENKINDPKAFVNITDDILTNIENSKKPELKGAQAILKRIRHRDLYRFLAQKLLTDKNLVKKYVRIRN
jgi:deoxynucleoside triphosphate triphosphohydrolase SAMHD1